MRSVFLFALALTAAACNRPPPAAQSDLHNPLEATARARGIVRDAAAVPTGVFERRHELGRDSLCAVPIDAREWRFALSASFGPGLVCTASGTIKPEGDGWRFSFAGADGCKPLLREEGDELQFPGILPATCDAVCPGRASLAGLRLPRSSWSEADARRLQITDSHGMSVRPCAR